MLTFDEFQKRNWKRCGEAKGFTQDWPMELWALAIAGEAGELCNILKKVCRKDFTLEQAKPEILKELADVIAYCNLAMSKMGASTEEEVLKKFDEVSKRVGWEG